MAIAAALVEHLVPQEGRQADEVPAPKPDVETLLAVRAPNQAFAIENEEDFLGLMAVNRDAVARRHRLDRHCERSRRDRAAQVRWVHRAAGAEIAALRPRETRIAPGLETENGPILAAIGETRDPASEFVFQRKPITRVHGSLSRHANSG